jgi:crossover junction endodeoxyribonuclease RuvC
VAISREQFEQMQERLRAKTSRADALDESPETGSAPADARIILGVDPSLRGTGYGVVRISSDQLIAVTHGTISCPKHWTRSHCLAQISNVLRAVLRDHQPEVCVVEGLFFAQNLKTALIMGEARGAAMAAVAEGGLDIYEISPRKVKQAIVGYGAAQKLAVARMIQRMLNLTVQPDPDAADALALAVAFANSRRRFTLYPPKKI